MSSISISASRPSTIGYYLLKLRDGGILRLPGARDAYCQSNGILYRLLVPSVDENVPLYCRLKEAVPFDHLWDALQAVLKRDIAIIKDYIPKKALELMEELRVLEDYITTKDIPISFPDPSPKNDLGRGKEIIESYLRRLSWPRIVKWGNSVVSTLS